MLLKSVIIGLNTHNVKNAVFTQMWLHYCRKSACRLSVCL